MRLWIRETWRVNGWTAESAFISRAVTDKEEELGAPSDFLSDLKGDEIAWMRGNKKRDPFRLRPSVFMPRWASRLLLEVVQVRVQRVQDISEEDARAEGVHEMVVLPGDRGSFVASFGMLWDELNHKRGCPWDSNPWVWAVTFKRVARD